MSCVAKSIVTLCKTELATELSQRYKWMDGEEKKKERKKERKKESESNKRERQKEWERKRNNKTTQLLRGKIVKK